MTPASLKKGIVMLHHTPDAGPKRVRVFLIKSRTGSGDDVLCWCDPEERVMMPASSMPLSGPLVGLVHIFMGAQTRSLLQHWRGMAEADRDRFQGRCLAVLGASQNRLVELEAQSPAEAVALTQALRQALQQRGAQPISVHPIPVAGTQLSELPEQRCMVLTITTTTDVPSLLSAASPASPAFPVLPLLLSLSTHRQGGRVMLHQTQLVQTGPTAFQARLCMRMCLGDPSRLQLSLRAGARAQAGHGEVDLDALASAEPVHVPLRSDDEGVDAVLLASATSLRLQACMQAGAEVVFVPVEAASPMPRALQVEEDSAWLPAPYLPPSSSSSASPPPPTAPHWHAKQRAGQPLHALSLAPGPDDTSDTRHDSKDGSAEDRPPMELAISLRDLPKRNPHPERVTLPRGRVVVLYGPDRDDLLRVRAASPCLSLPHLT